MEAAALTTVNTTGKSGEGASTGGLSGGTAACTAAKLVLAAPRARSIATIVAMPKTRTPRAARPPKTMNVLSARAELGRREGPRDDVTGRVVVNAPRDEVGPKLDMAGSEAGRTAAIGSDGEAMSGSVGSDSRANASTSNGGGVVGRSSEAALGVALSSRGLEPSARASDWGCLLVVMIDSRSGRRESPRSVCALGLGSAWGFLKSSRHGL
jgi:hypothetical protein